MRTSRSSNLSWIISRSLWVRRVKNDFTKAHITNHKNSDSVSLPSLFDKVYVVVGLLLVPDVLESCLLPLRGQLLSRIDVLLLSIPVGPHYVQLILVSSLLERSLGLQSLHQYLLLVGFDCLRS